MNTKKFYSEKYYYRVVVVSPIKNVYTWLLITSAHCDGDLAAKNVFERIFDTTGAKLSIESVTEGSAEDLKECVNIIDLSLYD